MKAVVKFHALFTSQPGMESMSGSSGTLMGMSRNTRACWPIPTSGRPCTLKRCWSSRWTVRCVRAPHSPLTTFWRTITLFLKYSEGRQHERQIPRSEHPLNHKSTTPRILTYIITHLSSQHYAFLEGCWPGLLKNLPIVQGSDFIMFVTAEKRRSKIDMDLICPPIIGNVIV